jgi:hypothetical protein
LASGSNLGCGGWGNRGGGRVSRGVAGGKGREQTAEIVKVGTFFQLEVKVLLGEVEMGEPVLIHEFDDAADFLEFHDEKGWELVG